MALPSFDHFLSNLPLTVMVSTPSSATFGPSISEWMGATGFCQASDAPLSAKFPTHPAMSFGPLSATGMAFGGSPMGIGPFLNPMFDPYYYPSLTPTRMILESQLPSLQFNGHRQIPQTPMTFLPGFFPMIPNDQHCTPLTYLMTAVPQTPLPRTPVPQTPGRQASGSTIAPAEVMAAAPNAAAAQDKHESSVSFGMAIEQPNLPTLAWEIPKKRTRGKPSPKKSPNAKRARLDSLFSDDPDQASADVPAFARVQEDTLQTDRANRAFEAQAMAQVMQARADSMQAEQGDNDIQTQLLQAQAVHAEAQAMALSHVLRAGKVQAQALKKALQAENVKAQEFQAEYLQAENLQPRAVLEAVDSTDGEIGQEEVSSEQDVPEVESTDSLVSSVPSSPADSLSPPLAKRLTKRRAPKAKNIVWPAKKRGVKPGPTSYLHGNNPIDSGADMLLVAAAKELDPRRMPDGRYECPVCLATFKHSKHVRRHFVSHTRARPFSCIHCQMQFRRKDTCKRHQGKCLTMPKKQRTRSSKRSHITASVASPESDDGFGFPVECTPESSIYSPLSSRAATPELLMPVAQYMHSLESPRSSSAPPLGGDQIEPDLGVPLYAQALRRSHTPMALFQQERSTTPYNSLF